MSTERCRAHPSGSFALDNAGSKQGPEVKYSVAVLICSEYHRLSNPKPEPIDQFDCSCPDTVLAESQATYNSLRPSQVDRALLSTSKGANQRVLQSQRCNATATRTRVQDINLLLSIFIIPPLVLPFAVSYIPFRLLLCSIHTRHLAFSERPSCPWLYPHQRKGIQPASRSKCKNDKSAHSKGSWAV